MIDIKMLTLLPQDGLLQASTLEIKALQWYRGLALSFLPYNADLSTRMVELGAACERRLKALRCAADSLGLGACVDLPAAQDKQAPMTVHRSRFSVVDDAMADQLLQEALVTALEAHQFAQQLLAVNATPELERPLLDYVRQKQVECDVLRENPIT